MIVPARTSPQKGQVLHILNRYDRPRDGVPVPLRPVIVTSVGRVYFTVHFASDPEGKGRGRQFSNQHWTEKVDGSPHHALYADPREREEELEADRIIDRLRSRFIGTNGHNVPIEALRQLAAILDGLPQP